VLNPDDSSTGRPFRWFLNASFVLAWARLLVAGSTPRGIAFWPDWLFLSLWTLVTIEALARRLSWQNALMVLGVMGPLALLGQGLEPLWSSALAHTADSTGGSWTVGGALLWVATVLTARGVGRLVLRPWRGAPTYGFYLLGVTAALTALLDMDFQWLSADPDLGWKWRLAEGWAGSAWAHSGGVILFALVLQVAAAPWLINKKPVLEATERQPLAVWLMLAILFATRAATQGRWRAAGVAVLGGVVCALAATPSLFQRPPFVLVKRPGAPVRSAGHEQK